MQFEFKQICSFSEKEMCCSFLSEAHRLKRRRACKYTDLNQNYGLCGHPNVLHVYILFTKGPKIVVRSYYRSTQITNIVILIVSEKDIKNKYFHRSDIPLRFQIHYDVY